MRLVAVKTVGALGRVVIPSELRESRGMHPGTPIDILVDEDSERIIIQPARGHCVFCGARLENGGPVHRGKPVCPDCIGELIALEEGKG